MSDTVEGQPLRYPEDHCPVIAELPSSHPEFEAAREAFLIDYGINTARAYWGDLEAVRDWAEARGKDVMRLTDTEFRQYLALLKRRGYSPNTIRRRRTAFRGFIMRVASD